MHDREGGREEERRWVGGKEGGMEGRERWRKGVMERGKKGRRRMEERNDREVEEGNGREGGRKMGGGKSNRGREEGKMTMEERRW